MKTKRIFQLSFLALIVLGAVATIYMSNQLRQKQKIGTETTKAEEGSPLSEYKPADDKADPNQWAEFVHPDLKYQFRYPQEFQVEKRGKVGNIEDLVALNYTDGNKRLTVVKIQITNATSEEKTSKSEKGRDNNGNQVIVFKKPFSDSKTITIIGTIYPNTGSNYRFEEVIQKIIESLK